MEKTLHILVAIPEGNLRLFLLFPVLYTLCIRFMAIPA